MSDRKVQHSPNFRLKLLDTPYICGKDHPITNPQPNKRVDRRQKIDEAVARKLQIPSETKKSRVNTEQSYSQVYSHSNQIKSTKLSPIKQGKGRVEGRKNEVQTWPTEDEQKLKLKLFLNNKDLLLDHWRKKEEDEKQLFLKRLKKAEKSHKSLCRLGPQSKKSLKAIHERDETTKQIEKMKMNNEKTPIKTIQDLQMTMERYYVQNLLALMQESKKSLLQNKKQIKKKLEKEQRSQQRQAKKQLASQIEQQLLREQELRQQNQQKYRRQLQQQLENELYSERQLLKNRDLPMETNYRRSAANRQVQIQINATRQKQPPNPEQQPDPSKVDIKFNISKSMIDLNTLRNSVNKASVDPLSPEESLRITKIMKNDRVEETEKQIIGNGEDERS